MQEKLVTYYVMLVTYNQRGVRLSCTEFRASGRSYGSQSATRDWVIEHLSNTEKGVKKVIQRFIQR